MGGDTREWEAHEEGRVVVQPCGLPHAICAGRADSAAFLPTPPPISASLFSLPLHPLLSLFSPLMPYCLREGWELFIGFSG